MVRQDLTAVNRGLEKVGPKGAAVVARDFVQWVAEFCTVKNTDVLAKTYVSALADFPEDLAVLAMDRVKATYQYNKPPKPRDLMDAVRDEMTERLGVKTKLLQANLYGRDPLPPPIERDVAKRKAECEAIMAKVMKGVTA